MTEHIVHLDNIEELVLAKYFIEQELFNKKEIDKKMSLQEFISQFLRMNENVAIYNMNSSVDIVPFFIYRTNNDTYVFFSEQNEYVERTTKFLKKKNYDLSNLKRYESGYNILRIGQNEYVLDI